MFSHGINKALKKMGHEVVKFNWKIPKNFTKNKNWKKRTNDRLISELKNTINKKGCDLFLSDVDQRFVFTETIERIKNFGFPMLNIATDDLNSYSLFRQWYGDIAPIFDYNLTFQPGTLDRYKCIGATSIFFPHGADPEFFKPYDVEQKYDVTFTGGAYRYRPKVVNRLINQNVNLKVFGAGWTRRKSFENILRSEIGRFLFEGGVPFMERIKSLFEIYWDLMDWNKKTSNVFNPPPSHENMVKMYSQSKITLNFSGGYSPYRYNFNRSIKTLKGRDIEAIMSGAFLITEHTEAITHYFKIGKEVETYKTIKELVDKIKYYLKNPDEIIAIRKAGKERALKEFTWEKSLEKLFKDIHLC